VRIVARRIIPERVGRRATDGRGLERRDGADPIADQLHDLPDDLLVRTLHAGLQDEEADGQLALEDIWRVRQVGLPEALVCVPQRRRCAGRHR
jgi:hypothetical protein